MRHAAAFRQPFALGALTGSLTAEHHDPRHAIGTGGPGLVGSYWRRQQVLLDLTGVLLTVRVPIVDAGRHVPLGTKVPSVAMTVAFAPASAHMGPIGPRVSEPAVRATLSS